VLNLDHSEKVQLLKEAVASSRSSLGLEEVATVASSSYQPLRKRQKLLQKHSVGTTEMLKKEILGYLVASANFNASQDEFWRENFGKNPNLANAAQDLLTLSAASVPVESLFSTLGFVLNSK
jgi:hypothetical protein